MTKEKYIVEKIGLAIREHLKENPELTLDFMFSLKEEVENWSSEYDNNYINNDSGYKEGFVSM